MGTIGKCNNCGSTDIASPSNEHEVGETSGKYKICEEYDSDDADVELISSDNYRFKVHSYRLQYSSLVFREMISMAHCSTQRDPIILTHQYVECSQVVKRALDIIYTLNVGGTHHQDANTLMYVIDFANKWDIAMIIDLLQKEVRRRTEKEVNRQIADPSFPMFDHLRLALKLKDYKLACDVFASNKKSTWENEDLNNEPGHLPLETISLDHIGPVLPSNVVDEEPVENFANSTLSNGGDMHDLGGSYYPYFLTIPLPIVYIILRAQHLAAHKQGHQAGHFRALMKKAYPHYFANGLD